MLQGKRTRKMVAATLLTILLTDTFAPGISYALTAGPTQPEATNFEPVDTTDMVNLQTGNFIYNIPLVEVPGPEGSYPLALSYHAGIQTNEDASWVGLGWSLNPGAISRSVNGYPDDWVNPLGSNRVYWSGGQASSYQLGVTIGIANTPIGVNAGLSFSNDTYQGFGVGFDVGVRLGIPGSPLQASMGIGVSPYGGSYFRGGLSSGVTGGSLGINVTVGAQALQAGFSAGNSLLGISMSTGSGKPSLTMGGLTSSVSSSKSAGIETETKSWGVDIPLPAIPVSISLGYSKTRYKTDETTNVTTQGSLYSSNAGHGNTIPDNTAFDSYSLVLDPTDGNFMDYPDPTLQQGGSYPNFDDYQVNAQGLGGEMRPYQYQGQVFGQNRIAQNPTGCAGQPNCTGYNVQYFSPKTTVDPTPQFRFTNDFSNTFQQRSDPYAASQLSNSTALNAQTLPFDLAPVHGLDGNDGFSNNQLAGSRHIDTEIKVRPYNIQGYDKSKYSSGMIEGFTITNESGVTYTFGLPAYSYGEEAYQEKLDHSNGYSFNRQKKTVPYAYTWYLTSVTGPDYVDRNNDGMADDGDWGYWVDFEYGKWTGNYVWRNPSQGYNTDEDNEWQNCSMGYKEVYYLNAIRTRTHVALFEKDVRVDGKGEANIIFDTDSPTPNYLYPGVFNGTSQSTLQLSHIYLMNASDENYVTPTSGTLNGSVLDKTDVDMVGRTNLEQKALRVIDFFYDNSLCQNTANSFISTPGQLSGKLTLLGVDTRGKGGSSILPPTKFQYDLGSNAVTQPGVTLNPANGATPANFVTTNKNFNIGDLVMSGTLNVFCGVITNKSPSSPYTYTLANCNYTGSATTTTISTTKNPPYNKDAYDAWGMYKSDISAALLTADLNTARMTTTLSAKATDAWSLRNITTPMGAQININYESDSYYNSSAEPNQLSLVIDKIDVNAGLGTMTFTVNKAGNDNVHLGDSYQAGNPVSAVLLQEFQYPSGVPPQDQDGSQTYGSMITDTRTNLITYNGTFDNSMPNGLGYGYNLGYYPTTTLSGSLVVQSVDDVNNKITVTCPEPFLLGNAYKTVPFKFLQGGSFVSQDQRLWMSNSYGGNLFIKNKAPLYGGGLRVSTLSVNESLSGTVFSTAYDYNDDNGICSGVSSYTPSMGEPCFDFPATYSYNFYIDPNVNAAIDKSIYYKGYRRILYKDNSVLFSLAREMPAPGVMYGYVNVSKQVQNPDEASQRNIDGTSKTQYQFEVFKGNMVGRYVNNVTQTGSTTASPVYTQIAKYFTLAKFLGAIGNVKTIIQFDDKGKKLTETDNHYLHDDLINSKLTADQFMPAYKSLLNKYKYQGFIQERYAEVKLVGQQPNTANNGMKATICLKEEYPCINTGQTVINFVNGTKTSSQNLGFDFYSGAVTTTVETDAYGNNIMTETVPAYSKYAGMGLKVDNTNNKNMLTQVAETKKWTVDGSNTHIGLISADVSTWDDGLSVLDKDGAAHVQDGRTETVSGIVYKNGDVWRQRYTYDWITSGNTTDGLTPAGSFTDFDFAHLANNASPWLKSSEVTLYDVNSKSLEGKDVNGDYAATRMGYNNSKVVLSGSPANFYEIACSGAEDEGITKTNNMFVQAGDGTVSSTAGAAHTGSKGLLLASSGAKGFTYSVSTSSLTANRWYKASAWVKPVSGTTHDVKLYYSIDGAVIGNSASSNSPSARTAGGWTQINVLINGANITGSHILKVWCQNDNAAQVYADDMRFQPLNAAVTAYVYDVVTGELTHVLDNDNLYARYEYDAVGRLVRTYKEKLGLGEIKKSQNEYNYGSFTTYPNTAINQTYVKNNCPPDQGGSSVPVNVPQGAFVSSYSYADADTRAQSYAQYLANQQGTCILPAPVILVNNAGATIYRAILSGASDASWIFPSSGSITGTSTLKPGIYTITILQSGPGNGGGTYHFSYTNGSNTQMITGTSATFNNVNVSGTLTLTINN